MLRLQEAVFRSDAAVCSCMSTVVLGHRCCVHVHINLDVYTMHFLFRGSLVLRPICESRLYQEKLSCIFLFLLISVTVKVSWHRSRSVLLLGSRVAHPGSRPVACAAKHAIAFKFPVDSSLLAR